MVRNKSWLLSLFSVVGLLVAMDAVALDPCSRLPQGGTITVNIPASTIDTACDANCTGINLNVPMPPNPAWGFTNNSHAECALTTPGPANGKCKKSTICPPGYGRQQVGDVWKCVRAAYAEKKTCAFIPPKPLPFKIESAKNYVIEDPGILSSNYLVTNTNIERARSRPKGLCMRKGSSGLNTVALRGPAVGAAIKARLVDLPGVSVSLSRPGPEDMRPVQCLLPNCVLAIFKLPEGAQPVPRKLEITSPDGRTSDTQLTIVEGREWVNEPCKARSGGSNPGIISGGTSSSGSAEPTEYNYMASMGCPGTITTAGVTHSFTRIGQTFTVNAASGSVTAKATAMKLPEECGWQDAIKFKLEGPSGRDLLFTPRLDSGGNILFDAMELQLSNGNYSLTPPDEQHPNPEWPYGYSINISFSQ